MLSARWMRWPSAIHGSSSTDIGPVIDAEAHGRHRRLHRGGGARVVFCTRCRAGDRAFRRPLALIRVAGIAELEREVFGPVLHVATFKAPDIDDQVIARDQRHRLRPDLRAAHPHRRPRAGGRRAVRAGNVYVNRNQIGAIVGSQPFGGTGLSGTGRRPADRPMSPRFCRAPSGEGSAFRARRFPPNPGADRIETLPKPLAHAPTGAFPAPPVNPTATPPCRAARSSASARAAAALEQAAQARAEGCPALAIAPGLSGAEGLDGTSQRTLSPAGTSPPSPIGGTQTPPGRSARRWQRRDGPILPLITAADLAPLRDRAPPVHRHHRLGRQRLASRARRLTGPPSSWQKNSGGEARSGPRGQSPLTSCSSGPAARHPRRSSHR
jgi:RHH-type proline utilization regulon transcriptional repressor/proline dehydrogenase/delta 1-pyrroline-5-carboxylate dehydrogenase